jgi:hypothetical protein
MNKHHTTARRKDSLRVALATLAATTVTSCMALASLLPAGALALPTDGSGNYTQILCADPVSENGLGLSGMPEGLTNPVSLVNWQVTVADVNCAAGRMVSAHGVPMLVAQTNTYPQGTWSALLYQAPANATINGGTIYRAERAEGTNNGFMGIIQQGGDYTNLYSLPRNNADQGDWFAGNIAARGTFSLPFAPENVVNLTISPDEKHWDVNATCDPNGNNNSSCTLNAGQWEYRIFGGDISLHAPNDPQVTNISGALTSDSPLHGVESITFSATDEGPGLAYIKLVVDGQTVESQTMDTNSGRCVPLQGHDAYTWAYQVPCKTSLGGRTYDLNTATAPDGTHHVQVVVEDAAGNQSTVLDRTVNVLNSTVGSLGATQGAGTGPASPTLTSGVGSANALLGTGAPNGRTASETAVLRLGVREAISRSFAHRALTVTGRLLSSTGNPIGNATLDVLQRPAGTSSLRVVGHVKTGASGTFTAKVPAGPSRLIEIAYRAWSGDPIYAALATVKETVAAGVQLKVSPRQTGPYSKIVLTGQVQGPVPKHGVTVELLVHYRGAWQPLRMPLRTDRHGRWQAVYPFQGAKGRFPFKAAVPAGQAGFPFTTGDSRIVDVKAG